MSREVYVIEGKRTPFGSFGGSLSEIEATALGSVAIKGVLASTGLDPKAVNEVIIGQILPCGAGQSPARQAMRGAGIADSAAALTINKACGSGLKSVMLGANSICLGESELVIAGGMENMSLAPYFLRKARYGFRMGNGELVDHMNDALADPGTGRTMGEIAEGGVDRNGTTREEQDEFAIRSYRQAQAAMEKGIFKREIVPVTRNVRGKDVVISEDEEVYRVDFDKVTSLKPVFRKNGTITVANASSISDGAAMLLLAGADAAKRHNLTPKARIVASATSCLHPDYFPEAPAAAIQAVCNRAGLKIEEIDLFEINEAFASVALLAINQLSIPISKVNVNGGACAIGHPVGASGARLGLTVVRELQERNLRYGLATLCLGGGEAVAVIFERT
ncbi:MAG: thiolase family protein [Desulfuromonadaceae bacterium]|nr:thiolase family protein [Desulfuromonadaceae bacterium]